MLRRMTLAPASISLRITSGSEEAGPRVAMILVRRYLSSWTSVMTVILSFSHLLPPAEIPPRPPLTKGGIMGGFAHYFAAAPVRGSERDVVVEIILGRGCRCGGGFGRGAGARRIVVDAAVRGTAAAAPAQHLHLVGDDLGGVAVLAFLVLPLAGLQASLDEDLRAFLEVFAHDLGELAEEHHAVPFGALLVLSPRHAYSPLSSFDTGYHHLRHLRIASTAQSREAAEQNHNTAGLPKCSLIRPPLAP